MCDTNAFGAFGHQEDLHGIEEPTTKSPCCSSPCRAKGFCTSQQRKVTEASHLRQWIIGCWDGIWVVDTICRVVSPLNAMICYDDIFKKGWFSGFILRSSAWNVTSTGGASQFPLHQLVVDPGPSPTQAPLGPRSAPASMHQHRTPSPPHAVL